MKLKYLILLAVIGTAFIGIFTLAPRFPRREMMSYLLNLVFPITISPEDLAQRYREGKVKILVVPGHDNKNSGASFNGVREADLNLELASNLFDFLKQDQRFDVIGARDFINGKYIQELSSYFSRESETIKEFREKSKAVMEALINAEIAERKTVPNHGFAKETVSLELYGINKWANENEMDIVIHLHFNDYPRKNKRSAGEYTGFAIYVPEAQYPNSKASQELAKSIFDELKGYVAVSDLHFEKEGVVEDQELIAVGSNASREGVSMLIEYGYIYEQQFVNPEVRKAVLYELAYRTYRGIKSYFINADSGDERYKTTLLPYYFDEPMRREMHYSRSVLALQAALSSEGLYPPPGRDLRECPINGNFGQCTDMAVKLFQEKYKEAILKPLALETATGVVGRTTLKKLNELYGN